MKLMQKLLTTVLVIAFSNAAFAQTVVPRTAEPITAAATPEMTVGEVRKIDKDAKKITLKHGEIKNLDMPAMTMVFQVKDAAMLDKIQAGDKVKFSVIKTDSGFVVTELLADK